MTEGGLNESRLEPECSDCDSGEAQVDKQDTEQPPRHPKATLQPLRGDFGATNGYN